MMWTPNTVLYRGSSVLFIDMKLALYMQSTPMPDKYFHLPCVSVISITVMHLCAFYPKGNNYIFLLYSIVGLTDPTVLFIGAIMTVFVSITVLVFTVPCIIHLTPLVRSTSWHHCCRPYRLELKDVENLSKRAFLEPLRDL